MSNVNRKRMAKDARQISSSNDGKIANQLTLLWGA